MKVSWDDEIPNTVGINSQYMEEEKKMFETTNQMRYGSVLSRGSPSHDRSEYSIDGLMTWMIFWSMGISGS